MSSTVITGIGELVTNDPERDGLLGVVRDAALVIEGDRVAWVGAGRRRPGRRRGGRRGRPGGAAGLRRQPHAPGLRRRPGRGVRRPDGRRALHRRRDPHDRRRHPRGHRRAAHRARRAPGPRDAAPRHHDRRDQERLRAYGRTTRRAGSRSPGSSPTRRPSWAPTWCRRSTRRPRGVRRPGDRSDARRRGAVRPLDRRVLRDAARSTPTRRARCWPPAPPRGCAGACTPTSSVPARASGWPASSAWSRSTTAPTSPTTTSTALRDSGTIATLLPGVEFSTRQPYPDARRLLDAGVRVAIASDCNPGSCYTSSMPLCVALAVREMRMSPAEAVHAATKGGADALDRDRRRRADARAPGRTWRSWTRRRTSISPIGPASTLWPVFSQVGGHLR